jgi:hypothetical protein
MEYTCFKKKEVWRSWHGTCGLRENTLRSVLALAGYTCHSQISHSSDVSTEKGRRETLHPAIQPVTPARRAPRRRRRTPTPLLSAPAPSRDGDHSSFFSNLLRPLSPSRAAAVPPFSFSRPPAHRSPGKTPAMEPEPVGDPVVAACKV